MKQRLTYYCYFLRSLFRINWGLLTGMWKLTRVHQPAVTFFGGSRLSSTAKISQTIIELAQNLAHEGFSIITGGGPGVMEAANYGAAIHAQHHAQEESVLKQKRITSMGIGIAKIDIINPYVQDFIVQPYFFTRKWLLVRYSMAFVVGPGGFGTLDELGEILTLIQTHSMPAMPIILLDTQYWKPLQDWIYNSALKEKLITENDAKLIYVTDSAQEALERIKEFHNMHGQKPEQVGITAPPKKNAKA
jgi:uncharacterized protein (TIGR00730 family)